MGTVTPETILWITNTSTVVHPERHVTTTNLTRVPGTGGCVCPSTAGRIVRGRLGTPFSHSHNLFFPELPLFALLKKILHTVLPKIRENIFLRASKKV